jgi:hypothetical protein
LVADTEEDGPVPDEDENAAPADDANKKVQPPQPDQQMLKAIEVLKNRAS